MKACRVPLRWAAVALVLENFCNAEAQNVDVTKARTMIREYGEAKLAYNATALNTFVSHVNALSETDIDGLRKYYAYYKTTVDAMDGASFAGFIDTAWKVNGRELTVNGRALAEQISQEKVQWFTKAEAIDYLSKVAQNRYKSANEGTAPEKAFTAEETINQLLSDPKLTIRMIFNHLNSSPEYDRVSFRCKEPGYDAEGNFINSIANSATADPQLLPSSSIDYPPIPILSKAGTPPSVNTAASQSYSKYSSDKYLVTPENAGRSSEPYREIGKPVWTSLPAVNGVTVPNMQFAQAAQAPQPNPNIVVAAGLPPPHDESIMSFLPKMRVAVAGQPPQTYPNIDIAQASLTVPTAVNGVTLPNMQPAAAAPAAQTQQYVNTSLGAERQLPVPHVMQAEQMPTTVDDKGAIAPPILGRLSPV